MKKTILLSVVGGFIAGAIISPIAGMAIGSTRNLILNMSPDEAILTLADKIDEESGKNDRQEQKINKLTEATSQQNEEMATLKKNQEIANCQKRKEDCENKIYNLENGELQINRPGVWKGSRNDMIKKLQNLIGDWENEKKEYEKREDSSTKKENIGHIQDQIDNAETEIAKIKQAVADEQIQKQILLDGECKSYQSPCE